MPMPCVNLVPARRRRARRRARQFRRCAVGGAIYLMLLGLAYGGAYMAWGAGGEPVEAEILRIRERVQRTQRTLTHLETQLDETAVRLAANRSVGSQPDWSRLLAVLADQVDEKVVIRRLTLRPDGVDPADPQAMQITNLPPERASGRAGGFTFEVVGIGLDQAAVWDFALRLEKVGLFDAVRMISSQGESFLGRRGIAFTLSCRMNHGGSGE